MTSSQPQRTVAEHQARVRELLEPLRGRAVERVPVTRALGRTLAQDLHAPLDLPVFRNSSMDGYAVAAASVAAVPAALPVTGTIAAGDQGATALPAGTACKIMTGAPLPPGADCVVPVEDTDAGTVTVTVRTTRRAGDFVREPGDDVRRGTLLTAAGVALTSRHIAVLAAVGMTLVPVRQRVTAAIITTGDELVPAGATLTPGQIYDSNGIALAAALAVDGVSVTEVAHSQDDVSTFLEILMAAMTVADIVFTSGGLSMGDFEVVKQALTPLGGQFGTVAVQPGGPQGLSVLDGVPVLSFPGNPVSTLVSYEVFARPALRELTGLAPMRVDLLPVTEQLRSPAGKRQFQRGLRTPDGVQTASGQGSHLIAGMARADVLIDIPEGVTAVAAGETVRVWQL